MEYWRKFKTMRVNLLLDNPMILLQILKGTITVWFKIQEAEVAQTQLLLNWPTETWQSAYSYDDIIIDGRPLTSINSPNFLDLFLYLVNWQYFISLYLKLDDAECFWWHSKQDGNWSHGRGSDTVTGCCKGEADINRPLY